MLLRAPVDTIAAPPFPPHLQWVNALGRVMRQAARAAGADRVLGLLPAQLAAHAPLHEGVARALRAGRAAGGRRALPRLRRGRANGRPSRRPSRAWGSPTRCCSTRTWRCGGSTRTGAGPPATCSTARRACSNTTTARAPTRETELAIQELLGVEREPLGHPGSARHVERGRVHATQERAAAATCRALSARALRARGSPAAAAPRAARRPRRPRSPPASRGSRRGRDVRK